MKKILALFILFFLCKQVISKESGKSIPQFIITSVKFDASLNSREAAFIFKCKMSENVKINHEIKYSVNGENKSVKPDENGIFRIKVKPSKYKFQFFLDSNHYEIYSDSVKADAKTITEVTLTFKSSEIIMVEDKPVIYFYPQHKTNVNVKLDVKGELTFTYPTYKNGWSIEANPDGTIKHNNKEYNYLFWEGKSFVKSYQLNFSHGFVVETENLQSFLEEKLTAIGLNSKEQQDFITYWYPRMSANKSNFVHFIFKDEFSKFANLTIDPKPDNLFRVFMIWADSKDIELVTDMQEQELPKLKREGFSVVEWGGSQILNTQIDKN